MKTPANMRRSHLPGNILEEYSVPVRQVLRLRGDGRELWITRWHEGSPALVRSRKIAGQWQEGELIVSRFAGEPTLDAQGNLYFVHHFYDDGVMLEVDIYVAYRK